MRLIDADALLKAFDDDIDTDVCQTVLDYYSEWGFSRDTVERAVTNAPTIEAEPVRHGEWVDRYGNKYANHLYECSVCGEKALWRFEVNALGNEIEVQDLSDFCPNCGAKMDGE